MKIPTLRSEGTFLPSAIWNHLMTNYYDILEMSVFYLQSSIGYNKFNATPTYIRTLINLRYLILLPQKEMKKQTRVGGSEKGWLELLEEKRQDERMEWGVNEEIATL